MDFVTIDFETATSFRHSVCQVAVTTVINSEIVDTFSELVKPFKNEYNGRNIAIHGIHPYHTKDAKSFKQIYEQKIRPAILRVQNNQNPFIIAHNAGFDRSVFNKALQFNKLTDFEDVTFGIDKFWYCTHQLYRRKGFESTKLNVLCNHFGIPLVHHNAGSDSIACAKLMIKHIEESNL